MSELSGGRRKRLEGTPVGGGPAVPVKADQGEAGKGADPAARAFTTSARGGTSWAAGGGGYSLRKQRQAAMAAGQPEEGVVVPSPGGGAALPVPGAKAVPQPGEGSGLPVPGGGRAKAAPAAVPVAVPSPRKEKGGVPVPGGLVSDGEKGLPVPVASPVGDGVSMPLPSAESPASVSGEAGVGLPVPVRGERGADQEVVEVPSGAAPKRVFVPTPMSTPSSFVAVDDDWDEVEEEEVNERRMRAMSNASKRGIRITPRDVEIIRFLARYRYAAHHQVARFIGTSEKATSIRLHKLAEGRIIHKVEVTHGRNVWTPTADGIAIADVDMPFIRPQDVALSTMAHELGLVNLGIELELGGDNVLQEEGWPHYHRLDEESGELLVGERVLTTREIKQASMRFRRGTDRHEIMAEYKARMDAWDPSEGYPSPELLPGNEGMFVMYSDEYGDHLPDMVVMRDREADGSPRSIAIELELSRKPEKDLVRILQNFKESLLFDKLYYFAHKKQVAMALMRVNEREVGIPEENFKVLRYIPTKSKDPFWG